MSRETGDSTSASALASVPGLGRDISSSSVTMDSHLGERGNDQTANVLTAATSGGPPSGQDSFGVTVDGNSMTAPASARGAMEVAAEDSRVDQKDRWRKVFLNLRKNLKPRELAVWTLL